MSRTSELLTRARKQAGLSQRALAARADIPQASVSRIERDLISPRASTIERWLAACGMALEIIPALSATQVRRVLEEVRLDHGE